MERYRTLLGSVALTTGLALGPCALASEGEAGMAAPGEDVQTRSATEGPTEPPDIDTGTAGTTSGLTGADVEQEDETTGGGQSQADDMFQTQPAGEEEAPDYEVETPEPEELDLPDDPQGAELSGYQEEGEQDGEPQSSAEHTPNSDE